MLASARKFEGVTDATALVRLGTKPTSIQVRDAGGTIRTDTLPKYAGGTLVMRIDTFRSTKTPVRFGLFQTAQGWDAKSATWIMRIDTGGVHLPWTTPGGTRGPVVSSVRWTPGTDSLVMNVDSATVAALTNPADTLRGLMIAVDSADLINGARMRINGLTLHIPTGSSIRADTTIQTDVGAQTYVHLHTGPDACGECAAGFRCACVARDPVAQGRLRESHCTVSGRSDGLHAPSRRHSREFCGAAVAARRLAARVFRGRFDCGRSASAAPLGQRAARAFAGGRSDRRIPREGAAAALP